MFAPVIDALPQQQMRFSSNTDIFSQGVVPLLTIFRTIGPLWDGNTPDCSCSNNMKFLYVSNRLVMMQRKKKKKKGATQEPKCHHSIKGDSDSFWLLMAGEVVAAAAKESCRYSYWKSMFDASVDNNFSQA